MNLRLRYLLPLLLLCMLPSAAARNLSFGVQNADALTAGAPTDAPTDAALTAGAPTDAPTDAPDPYVVVTDAATCADAGFEPIVTIAECDAALAFFEYGGGGYSMKDYQSGSTCTGSAIHYGCYVGQMGPYLNTCITFLTNILPGDDSGQVAGVGVACNDLMYPADCYCKRP